MTGLLADYVTVECRCGAVLMVPARMATGIDGGAVLVMHGRARRQGSPRAGREGAAGRGREDGQQPKGEVMATQLHLSVRIEDAPRYRINPRAKTGGPFAVLDIGPLDLTIDSPAELRRLADVAANAADVLEQAQAQARPASRCCDQATHDALRESDAWNRLEFVGYQDDGDGGQLELRNCKCGGTISRPAYGGVVMEVVR